MGELVSPIINIETMTISHIFELANDSGGTLYLMLLLLLVALTVIIERTRYLSNMQHGGEQLIAMLKEGAQKATLALPEKLAQLPHAACSTSCGTSRSAMPTAQRSTAIWKRPSCTKYPPSTARCGCSIP